MSTQHDELSTKSAYEPKSSDRCARAEALAAACAADERALLGELREAGIRVTSVWDFVAEGGAPPKAVPILVSHLSVDHHERIWQGIVRALSVKHARAYALGVVTELYCAEERHERRRHLASAIGCMATLAEVQHLPDIEKYRGLFR